MIARHVACRWVAQASTTPGLLLLLIGMPLADVAGCVFVCLLLYCLRSFPWRRLQRPGARDPPAGDVVLRVLPRHVPPPEGVPHVHHRRDAPHAGALHQLRDAAALAEGFPWCVFFLLLVLVFCVAHHMVHLFWSIFGIFCVPFDRSSGGKSWRGEKMLLC